jgi:FkbM family methyltransferase
MPRPSNTFAEWRTVIANRLFVGSPLLDMISAAKWACYPMLVRFAPWLAMAIHEPESTRVFWRSIAPGMVVVDGGSNRGGYSILAARRAGAAGRVFAFEPEPANFARLSRRLSRLRNVEPVQKAIAGRSGEAVLHLDTFHAGHTLSREVGVGATVTVAVTSLDDFMHERGLPGFDVVKFDIEGAELEAIDGMRGALTGSRRPVVLCEVHPPITPEQISESLGRFGYRCELLDAEYAGTAHEVPVHIFAQPPTS